MNIYRIKPDTLVDMYCDEVGLDRDIVDYNDALNYFLYIRPYTVRRFGRKIVVNN